MIDISSTTRRILYRAGALWGQRLEAARIVRELGDSSDRVLADIGIARGDVGTVATGRFGQP